MDKGKIKEKFAEVFSVNPQLANASFDIFIRKVAEELNPGEAFSVPGLGIFQKKNDNVLHFIDPLQEENDKLFVKIEVPQAVQNQFDLDEGELDFGVEGDVVDLTDENQLAELESLENEITEKVKTFEKLEDFDPYALIVSEVNETAETEAETELETEIEEEVEGENIHEATNELDEDLQKELEEQLFDDLENDLSNELSDELNSEEEHSEEKEEEIFDNAEEPEEKIEEITEGENENEEEKTTEEPVEEETREDEIMSEEELQNAFDDLDNEPSEAKKEEDNDNDDKKSQEEGKKKSLFSFLKKGKKKDKSKGKEQKEKDENGEGEEGKKRISKKLLIILIAVFVLITAGGVYYFFFMGDETHEEKVSEEHGKGHKAESEHGGEHEKESIEDSLWKHRKRPLTPEEIGETHHPEAKYSVDINNPEKSTNETYLLPPEADLEDPLIIKEFPHEKKITHTIYENDGKYMVQISSWKRSSRAQKIVNKLRRAGYNAFIVKAYLPALGGTWYRVRIGFFNTLKEAEEFIKKKEYLHVR